MTEPVSIPQANNNKARSQRKMGSPPLSSELPRSSIRSPSRPTGGDSRRCTLPLPSRHLSLSQDIQPREDPPTLVAVGRQAMFSVKPQSPHNGQKTTSNGERLKSQFSVPQNSADHSERLRSQYSVPQKFTRGHPQSAKHSRVPSGSGTDGKIGPHDQGEFDVPPSKISQRRRSDSHREGEMGVGDLSPRLSAGFLVTAVVPETRGTSYEEELENHLSQVRVSAQIWRQRAIFERSRRKELEEEFESMKRGYRSAVQEQQAGGERKYERLKNKTRLLMRRCEQLRSERSELEDRYSALLETATHEKQELNKQITNLSAELSSNRKINENEMIRYRCEQNSWLSHYRLLLNVALVKIKQLESSITAQTAPKSKTSADTENNKFALHELARATSCPNRLNELSLCHTVAMRRKSVSNEDITKLRAVTKAGEIQKLPELVDVLDQAEKVNNKHSRSSLKLQLASKYFELSKSLMGSRHSNSCDTIKPSTTSSSLASLTRRGRPGSSAGPHTLSDGYVSEESDGWKGKIRRKKGRKQSKHKHRSLDRSDERGSSKHLDGLLGQSDLDLAPSRPMSMPQSRSRKSDRSGTQLLRRFQIGLFVSHLGSKVEPQDHAASKSRGLDKTHSDSFVPYPDNISSGSQSQKGSVRCRRNQRHDEDMKTEDYITFQVGSIVESLNDDVKNTQKCDATDGAAITFDVSTGRNSTGEISSRFERLRERRNGLAELPVIPTGSVKSSQSKLDQLAKSIKTYLQ